MSLKQQIQEFTSESCSVGLINEVVSFYGNGKAVIVRGKLFLSRDDVLASLDEATKQINRIMYEDYWTSNFHLNEVRKKVLSVLEGEQK